MFVIPGGRKVFTCISSVFIFTADIGVGSNESESFVIIPASHQFHSVSSSGSGGGDGFISQNTVVGSFRSQRNAVDDRHRIAVITLPLFHHLLTPCLFHLKNFFEYPLKHVLLFQKILLHQYCNPLSLIFQYCLVEMLNYLYSYI